MFDRHEIYRRFASCFPVETTAGLARIVGVHHTTAFQWKSCKNPIPWIRLKALVDDQGISWDWLLEGSKPKYSGRKRRTHRPFDRHAINQRFLSLFPPDISQEKLGKEIGVNGTTVFKWRHDMSQVPWERLKDAVDIRGTTWEWLLEGRK